MSGRLRIVHAGSHDRIASGGSVQLLRAALGQRLRGHDVSCVFHRRWSAPRAGHPSLRRLTDEGVPVRALTMTGPGRWLGVRRMRALLAAEAIDVVHAHRERALALALDALGDRSPAFSLVAQRGNSNRLTEEHRRLLGDPRVAAIVAVAEDVRRTLVQDGIDAARVRVVYGSVDADRFRPDVDGSAVRRELGVPAGAPLVGILANLDAKKSHRTFLAAAARVRACRPDARFVLLGGGDEGPLRQEAESLGLGEALLFAGFREDVPECLAALDVSVSSSGRSEGLTGAIRESLAMARPVVCTRVGGNPELVRDGETGVLVEPRDPEALAEGILRTLAHPEEAAARARAGRDIVLREMTDEVRLDRLEALYREIRTAGRLPRRI